MPLGANTSQTHVQASTIWKHQGKCNMTILVLSCLLIGLPMLDVYTQIQSHKDLLPARKSACSCAPVTCQGFAGFVALLTSNTCTQAVALTGIGCAALLRRMRQDQAIHCSHHLTSHDSSSQQIRCLHAAQAMIPCHALGERETQVG